MVSPEGGTPFPVQGGCQGTGSQDFWSPCSPDQAKSQDLLQLLQSLQPLTEFVACSTWERLVSPRAAACLHPSFISLRAFLIL